MPSCPTSIYQDHAQKIEAELRIMPMGHPLRELLEDAAKLLASAAGHSQLAAHDKSHVALIDKGYHWRGIDTDTPRGAKMQLIIRPYGVAVYGTIGSGQHKFTHWCPLPTFRD